MNFAFATRSPYFPFSFFLIVITARTKCSFRQINGRSGANSDRREPRKRNTNLSAIANYEHAKQQSHQNRLQQWILIAGRRIRSLFCRLANDYRSNAETRDSLAECTQTQSFVPIFCPPLFPHLYLSAIAFEVISSSSTERSAQRTVSQINHLDSFFSLSRRIIRHVRMP